MIWGASLVWNKLMHPDVSSHELMHTKEVRVVQIGSNMPCSVHRSTSSTLCELNQDIIVAKVSVIYTICVRRTALAAVTGIIVCFKSSPLTCPADEVAWLCAA